MNRGYYLLFFNGLIISENIDQGQLERLVYVLVCYVNGNSDFA